MSLPEMASKSGSEGDKDSGNESDIESGLDTDPNENQQLEGIEENSSSKHVQQISTERNSVIEAQKYLGGQLDYDSSSQFEQQSLNNNQGQVRVRASSFRHHSSEKKREKADKKKRSKDKKKDHDHHHHHHQDGKGKEKDVHRTPSNGLFETTSGSLKLDIDIEDEVKNQSDHSNSNSNSHSNPNSNSNSISKNEIIPEIIEVQNEIKEEKKIENNHQNGNNHNHNNKINENGHKDKDKIEDKLKNEEEEEDEEDDDEEEEEEEEEEEVCCNEQITKNTSSQDINPNDLIDLIPKAFQKKGNLQIKEQESNRLNESNLRVGESSRVGESNRGSEGRESSKKDSEERKGQKKRSLKKVWKSFALPIIGNPTFPLTFMYCLLFGIECAAKFSGWASNINIFKTMVPYFMISWITIQVTRLIYSVRPESIFPLYLSFIPFPLFCIFSRESHAYLSIFWLIFTQNMHLHKAKSIKRLKYHVKLSYSVFLVIYVFCVIFMYCFFIDVGGSSRFYGRALTINWSEEMMTVMTSLLVSLALYFQEVRNIQHMKNFVRKDTSTTITPISSSSSTSLIRKSSSTNLKYSIPFEDLQFDERNLLGKGSSGVVYKGTFDEEVVAIKKLVRDNISSKEAKILSSLSHKHIIGFKGISTRDPHDFYIITEFVDHGSLHDYLTECRKERRLVHPSLILKWSKQIAMGMDYLHTGAPLKIIHRDLKSRNILIDSNLETKIADFGWSRTTDDNVTSLKTNTVGTCSYMAPEVIRGARYDEKVDVWSYGVLVWEMLTGNVPYEGLHQNSILFGVGREPPILTLPIPTTCPPEFQELLTKCCKRDSSQRPSFKEIIKDLDKCSFTDTTELDFAQNQRKWKREIVASFRNQEKVVSSEMSTKDPQELLQEISEKEKGIQLKEEMIQQKEIQLRRRELFLGMVVVFLVFIIFFLVLTLSH